MCHADVVLELADRLLAQLHAGRELVVATVIGVDGSAPRTLGTSMAWDGERVIGSIAGGCVEGAVLDEAAARADLRQRGRVVFAAENAPRGRAPQSRRPYSTQLKTAWVAAVVVAVVV